MKKNAPSLDRIDFQLILYTLETTLEALESGMFDTEGEHADTPLLSIVLEDVQRTLRALEAKEKDLFLESLRDDARRLDRDGSRFDLYDGPGIALILDLVLDAIEGRAA